ncbi:protein kinase [Nocardia gipuzkoensis]|uniref:serine/threonine-protein kinase n=1 Tax=Nocardia gipuzkoensis TaxID=2749991 RepID=UPI001E65B467|nr:serine/threonine-protein kinase [Nocardia gipuzkoensis]UGT67760.1 protein kinase [Nocardia gipuzkoensis]
MNVPDIAIDLLSAGLHDAEKIGAGGFGAVYQCTEPSLGRVVAVKVLLDVSASGEGHNRFIREQESMGRLSGHPNIIDIYRVGTTPAGRSYLVMPHYRRGSLDQSIRRQGPCSTEQILRSGVKLCAALEFAHRNGILHRDVKPSNILLSQFDDPVLADFGIARREGELLTRTGIVLGSPAFTAPEVMEGHAATAAADIYSLGAVMFCMLTGHAVVERRTGESLIAQFIRVTDTSAPVHRAFDASGRVQAVVEFAMQRDPSDRPSSAFCLGQLVQQLQAELGLEPDPMLIPGTGPVHGPKASIAAHRSERANPAHEPTPPTVVAKYRPVRSPETVVIRDRLLDRLRAGGSRRLTLIHGPAGFGKTTLAAQWQARLAREGVRTAWLSLDNDDDNVVWFLDHLSESLSRLRSGLREVFSEELASQGRYGSRAVLTRLLAAVHEEGKRTVLIVDDWHAVSSAETTEAMGFLIDKGCHHLQLVITSRSHQGLPVASMRVRDELVEIDSSALRFSPSESQSFLLRRPDTGLSAADIETLHTATDGWPAALQLALLSIQSSRNPQMVLDRIDDHQHIAEYLAENVLASLDPAILDFILVTSVTARTCGDLACDLSGAGNGAQLLEEICSRGLFLGRTEEDPDWYRYHHLFGEFLRQRLRRTAPDRYRALHRSASEWFARNGFVNDAVEHGVAAGDTQHAAGLIESCGRELLEQSKMASLLALIGKLPSNFAERQPTLQVYTAWAHTLLHHRPHDVSLALRLAKSQLDAGQNNRGESSPLHVEISVVQAVADCFSDRVDRVSSLVADCLARPDEQPPLVTAAASNVATYAAMAGFDFDRARRWQEWAVPYHEHTNARFSVVYGTCLAGLAAWEQLDLHGAEEYFRNAVALAQQGLDGPDSYAARLAGGLLGDLLYQVGDLDRAEVLLRQSHELGAEGGIVEFKCATYGTGALLLVARGETDAARRLLDEGTDIAHTLQLPRLAARLDRDRYKCGFRPDPASDEALDTKLPGHTVRGTSTIVSELRLECRIRQFLAQGEARRASEVSELLCAATKRSSRPRAALEANLLRAVSSECAGHARQAQSIVTSALQVCAPRRLSRFVADIGSPMQSIAVRIRNDLLDGTWKPAAAAQYVEFLDLVTDVPGKPHGADSRTHADHQR